MPAAAVEEAPTTDGRARRAVRSRDAIVNALYDLISQGCPLPTAQDVAERAGVGTRTVFRHFRAMESLFAEIDSRILAEIQPLVARPPTDGPVTARVQELAKRRAELYERITPFMRSTKLAQAQSKFLVERLGETSMQLRSELKRWIPELQEEPALLEAFDLLLSFEVWDRLRGDQALSAEQALETIEEPLRQLSKSLAASA